MMTHPGEARLALYAGGDSGWLERRRTARHAKNCAECRQAITDFSALRSAAAELNTLPREISWSRLAAEMRANIRLGVEAGQCVERPASSPGHFAPRALVACASLAVLVAMSFWLERPAPAPAVSERTDQTVVQATANGIEIRQGSRSLGLMYTRAADVNYVAGAQGSMRARYVDADTGQITINDVYAQ